MWVPAGAGPQGNGYINGANDKECSVDRNIDQIMKTVRSGATGWLDEHEVSDAAAEQLMEYIRAALEWDRDNVPELTAVR
jgi:hypothetical protein